jgi:Zn-finger nucleic acid-binding protein
VEIDHCPKCRGVWLDRGELDKVIERSNAYSAAYARERHAQDDDDDDDHGGGGDVFAPRPDGRQPRGHAPPPPAPPGWAYPQQPYTYQQPQQHRRKSFWEELFD